MNLTTLPLAALVFTLAVHSAQGEVLWVDPVHGDALNPGTPAAPMASVSAALDSLAGTPAPHTIRLAPGVYSVATGEVFPWRSFEGLTFAGESAGRALVVPPPGASRIIDDGCADLTVTGVDFSGTGDQRLAVLAGGGSRATLEDCKFSNLFVILDQLGSIDRQMQILVQDSEFHGCWSLGGNLGYASSPAGYTRVRRCLFDGCVGVAGGAVFLSTGSNVSIHSSVIVNGTSPTNCIGTADLVSGCTIAYNAGPIPRLESTITPVIEDCIIAWNGDGSQSSVSSGNAVNGCLIHDLNGTDPRSAVAGPPLFVDGPGGDLRLRFGSPAVDALPASGTLDRTGRGRAVDGDLDMVARADIGALELRTLDRPGGRIVHRPPWHALRAGDRRSRLDLLDPGVLPRRARGGPGRHTLRQPLPCAGRCAPCHGWSWPWGPSHRRRSPDRAQLDHRARGRVPGRHPLPGVQLRSGGEQRTHPDHRHPLTCPLGASL